MTKEEQQTSVASVGLDHESVELDAATERRLVRKTDLMLMPGLGSWIAGVLWNAAEPFN
jgi:hypothetical protein